MTDKLTGTERQAIDQAIAQGRMTVFPPAEASATDEINGDYAFEIRVKNANILRAMKRAGINSAAELARLSGVNQSRVGELLNLKRSAIRKSNHTGAYTGEYQTYVDKISVALGVPPDELFSERQKYTSLRANKIMVEMTEAEVGFMIESAEERAQSPEALAATSEARRIAIRALGTLTEREETVCRGRFFEGRTLEDIAKEQRVGKELIRQIEKKALLKLKRQGRIGTLADVLGFKVGVT